MTYEELKAQDDWYRSFPDWGDDNEIILDNIRARLKAYASRHYFKMLTDIDMSLRTTSKDLVDSLLNAGFPKEKLVVENDEKAQIELDGIPYTISSTQTGHSYLYEDNNSRNFIDFIHTPANIVADFIIERYCSADWLEEESQRTLAKYKAYWVWERKRQQLAIKCSDLDHSVNSAIYFAKDYTQYRDDYISAMTATYGKGKVQKKGSLPKEGNQKLQKLLSKIGIAGQWQGIYSESQRHYLDDHYKNEVPIK